MHPFRSPLNSKYNKAKQNWNFPIQCVKGQHLLMLRDGVCGGGGRMRCQVGSTVRESMQHTTDTPNRNTSQRQRATFHPSISETFDRPDRSFSSLIFTTTRYQLPNTKYTDTVDCRQPKRSVSQPTFFLLALSGHMLCVFEMFIKLSPHLCAFCFFSITLSYALPSSYLDLHLLQCLFIRIIFLNCHCFY